jgi:fructose-specific phosphotransferase system IIC component
VVSVSIVAVGGVALGSVAAGLWLALGGMAVGPVAIGGAAFGYYANGALAWGRHAISPRSYDPMADAFFNPLAATLVDGLFQVILVATPLFLALGFLPSLMAKISERRTRRRLRRNPDTSTIARPG